MHVSQMLAVLLAAPLCISLPATMACAAQNPFTGTYTANTEDGPVRLSLSQDGSGKVSGTLKAGEEVGDLKGRVENGRVAGAVIYGGMSLTFTLTRDKDVLRFHMGEEEMLFKALSAPTHERPAAPEKKAVTKPATAGETSAPAGWKTYRNPVGLTFHYPPAWNLTDINGMLLLVPPGGQAPAGQMPAEIYSVVGMPVPGVSRVNDPRHLQMADGMVGQMFPYMRRSGKGEVVPLRGMNGASGLVVTYDGNNPTTGKPSRIRSYAVVHKGFLLQIQAWGDRDKVAARDTVLRQIYSSATSGPSEHDPRLTGTWAGSDTGSDRVRTDGGGRLLSSLASQSSSRYQILPDGTLVALTTSRSSISISSSKSIPESQRVDANIDTGDQQQWKKGRWYAGHGKIVVVMEDGTGLSADYQVEGGVLIIRFAGGATQRFTRF
jgi:hypothetical protein